MVQNNFDDLANEKQIIRILVTSLDFRAVWYIHAVNEPNTYANAYCTFLKIQFIFIATTYARCNTKHLSLQQEP